MAEDKQKLSGTGQDQYGTVAGDDGEGGERPASPMQNRTTSCDSSAIDTRYLRSIEGILRLTTIVSICIYAPRPQCGQIQY